MRRVIPIVLALVLVASVHSSAQELPTAQKWTDVEWFQVSHWKFTEAGVDTAMTLLFDHIIPAAREAWPGFRCLRHITGEWHFTSIVPVPEGPAAMEWEMTPAYANFLALLMDRLGEQSAAVFDEWDNAVARTTTIVALEPTGGM
jgi:hypothetical protein